MSEYRLFGETVTLSDSAERYIEMLHEARIACDRANDDFESWYRKSGDIETVLNNYPKEAQSLISLYALTPLYNRLTSEYNVYDISKENYINTCFEQDKIGYAYQEIAESYGAIVDEQEAAAEYRQERKDNRGRWTGGGFGVGGAIKGAATAGAMNMASGMGHSLINAVGNMGSSISASLSKRALYENANTLETLSNGIIEEIFKIFDNHTTLINELKGTSYISSSFDSDRPAALFENAKNLTDKAPELLVRSFTFFPYNYALLEYIFIHYPKERDNVWNIGKQLRIDMADAVEEVFALEYTDAVQNSEELAQEERKHILSTMQRYAITESSTLDTLEQDCIERISEGYENADKKTCLDMIEKIEKYDAKEDNKTLTVQYIQKHILDLDEEYLEKICQSTHDMTDKAACLSVLDTINAYDTEDEVKAPFIKKVQNRIRAIDKEYLSSLIFNVANADENECNELIEKINGYDTLQDIKQTFITKVQKQIESIWATEDREQFIQLYGKVSMSDTDAITECIQTIGTIGRTNDKDHFINALMSLNPQNVRSAAEYGIAKEKGGLALITKAPKLFIYNKLTLNGTVIHPDIVSMMNELRTQQSTAGEKRWGLFGGKKTGPENQLGSDTQMSSELPQTSSASMNETTVDEEAASPQACDNNDQADYRDEIMSNIRSLVGKYGIDNSITLNGNLNFQKKLDKAMAAYALITAKELPILICDQTIFGSAKTGYV